MSDQEHWTNGGPGRPDGISRSVHDDFLATCDPCDRWDSEAIATRNRRVGRTAALTIITLAAIMIAACAYIIGVYYTE